MWPNYLPVLERVPDYQYRNLGKRLLAEGIRSETQQSRKSGQNEKVTYSLPFAVSHVYDYKNGMPMETCRKIGKAGMNEGFAFLNGVRNNDILNQEYDVPFWNSTFKDPEKCLKRGLAPGDLGPASYAVLHDFPTPNGNFNQVQAIIDQIRELPHLKTHTITTLYPPGIFRGVGKVQQVVTVPCHGTVINVIILGGQLYLEMVQRSADIVVGEPHDRMIYISLWLALCYILRYEPGKLSITYLNAHYYENQREALREIISREPRPFPTITLIDPPNDIFSFRKHHFSITDYSPHAAIRDIPVTP